ncbi:MAG: hypothetical protein HWN80_01540 [Candidatus Lokiarchaeota archaeon]|nr:hypothetical protein [Candidatus Lokiarchaeota archaeon]
MNSSNSEEADLDKSKIYQKLNLFVSVLIILLTFLISLLNDIPVIIFLSLPAMFILTYCEEKLNFTIKIYSRYIYLINCLVFLALLVFWIFPTYLGITLINIQFIIFSLSLYIIFQFFMKLGYFREKDVLVIQNILAVTSFTIILYSFFPLVDSVYINFTSDPVLILISESLIHSIIILIITLISFYFLYARAHLYAKPWKFFNFCVIFVFLFIELICFTLINLKNIVLGVPGVIQLELIISTILLSVAFLSFILLNYIIKVFSREKSLSRSYYTCWFLISSIFLILIALYWNNSVILFFDLLFCSVLSLLNLKFGTVIDKIEEETFLKIAKFFFYALLLEIFFLFYSIFNAFLMLDYFIALFLSFCIIGAIFNILSSYEKLVSRKVRVILTSSIFAFNIYVVGFYFIEANIDYFYFYLVVPIIFCFLLYGPIIYLYKENIIKPKVLALYSYTSSWVLLVLIFVLNFFVINIYFIADFLLGTLLNIVFFTFCLVLLISFGKRIKRVKDSSSRVILNILSYPIIVEIFILLFTVFTIYFHLDLFLSSFLSLSIISVIFYLLSKEEKLFPKFPGMILNTITFYYGVIIVGYYSVIFTLGTFFIYFIPLITVCILSYIPIYYLYKKTILNHNSFLKYHFFCSIIIALTIFVFNFFIIINFFDNFLIILMVINVLYLTVVSYYIFKLGAKINIISNEFFKKFSFIVNLLIIIEFYAILFSIFNQELLIEPFLSAYFSTLPICLIINILSKNRIIFSDKSTIGINIVTLSFTSVLSSYYIFLLIENSTFVFVIPLLVFSLLMLLPLFYSSSMKVFSKLVEKLLLIDSLLISALLMTLPTITGLELSRFGVDFDYFFIILSTIFLFFGFLRYLEFLFDKFKFKESYIVSLKSSQIVIWMVISIAISLKILSVIDSIIHNFWLSFACSCLTFLVLNLVVLIPLENLKQRVFENDASKLDYYKIYKIYEYTKNISFFAIITSISALIALIIPSRSLLSLLNLPESLLFIVITNLGIFMLAYLIFSVVSKYLFKIDFLKTKSIFEISAWIFIKLLIFTYIFILPIQISMFLRIILPLLIIIFMTPITIYYLRSIFFISDRALQISKKFTFYLFSIALLAIFVDLFWIFSTNISFFSSNQALQIIILLIATYLFLNYYILKFDAVIERTTEFKMIKIFSGSSVVLFSFFSIFPSIFEYLTYIIFFIMLYLFISNRNRNFILRMIFYASISWFMFVKVILTLNLYMLIPTFNFSYFIIYFFIYNFSLILVLFLSIVFNMKKTNVIEKFMLYALISITSLLLLILNTVIPLIYNISISLFLFLLLTGNFFYRQKDERYKWFIRPCVLLLTFGLMSYLSYFILFNNPIFTNFNPILTFTLTSTITGIAYVGTYNKTPEKFRKITFYIAFTIYTISFPIFMYFFLNALFSLPLWDTFLFLITINIGIVLFYISIGIYYWKFSWAIWKAGWRIWILVPFVNFYLINELFTNVNIYTNALNFFDILSINGSFIISFVICIVLSLPFWYSWIKKHFTQVLIIVWSFSLFFLYWFSQNVFPDNVVITNIVFFVFAISLLVPLIYRLKLWKIMAILWLIYIAVNISFLFALFLEINLPLEINFSINLIMIGIFFLILSFFPNLKNIKNIILLGSYLTSLIGIFLTIFNIINAIILNFYISINLAFIILAMSLFSSRFLKLNKTFFNILISTILVVNFSLFTYNTLILIPNFELFSLFLAITVFGGSLFVFNKYGMIFPIKKIFPLTILSLGVSLTLSYLTYYFLPGSIYLAIAVLVLVNSIFLRSVLYEYRFILWYTFPVPIILIFLQFIVLIDLFQSPFIIILVSLILYTALFQIPCKLYAKKVKDQEDLKDFGLLKVDSVLSLLLHFEIGLLSYSVISEAVDFGFFETVLISIIIFFISTLFEIHLVKKVNEKIIYTFNLIAYIITSIGLFMFLNQFIAIDASLLVLNLVILLTLQFYTLYALSYYIEVLTQYDANKIKKVRNQIQNLLLNSIFIVVSLYISLFLSNLLITYNPLLYGYPSLSFTGMAFSLLMLVLNGLINRTIEIKLKKSILLCAFIFFQFFFAVFWVSFFTIFSLLDLFRIILILLSETIFTSYTIYLSGKLTKSEKWKKNMKQIYTIIIFSIYLEASLLFLGLFQLFFPFYESLMFSQIVLFLISIIEIYAIKSLKEGYMQIVHTFSFINISWILFIILYSLFSDSMLFLTLIVFLIILMQFYTNYSYFDIRRKFNPEKLTLFEKWKNMRQNILGWGVYSLLLVSILNILVLIGIAFHLIILILSLTTHLLAIFDKYALKFLGKASNSFISVSWIILIGFSFLFYLDWISIFFIQIIPIIIFLLIIQITYLFRLLKDWELINSNQLIIKSSLLKLVYLNLITWPLYYISPDFFITLNVVLVSFIILLGLTFLDKYIKAINEKIRKNLRVASFIITEVLLSSDIFLALEFFVNPNIILNLSLALFFFMIVNLALFKPFKRRKVSSFLYSLVLFLLLSIITFNISLSGWSFSWIFIGTLLYLFVFMLEELKAFFNNIVDNLRLMFVKLKNVLLRVYYSFFNFLRNNLKVIEIILCIFAGITVGIVFSDIVLGLLGWEHATLLALASSGIFISLLPPKKTDDIDQIFRVRMQRFITLWISFTVFVFALILPYITSFLFGIILILSSIIILGAILAVYIYRIEKKQKISIKWRFYTTIILIILFITWVLLFVIFYLVEVMV